MNVDNGRQLKLLIVCSTLNLDYPYGATPAIWQMLKGLYEVGCDTIVIPYRGKSVRTPWWRVYPNPISTYGEFYARMHVYTKFFSRLHKTTNGEAFPQLARTLTARNWRRIFNKILEKEKEIDAVMFVGVPLNQLTGLATYVKGMFDCPVIYYDLDVPTSLPKYGGFSFNYYIGANLSEYDAIVTPSEGVSAELMQLGAKRIFIVHFGVDPDLYLPIKTRQDIDVFFYATSDRNREKSISMMITEPSLKLDADFLVSGVSYRVDLGNAKKISMLPFSLWRSYAARSKINLNIPRENHANTYATSTSRPFELAAMESCIVSSPYNGLDKWFRIGEEIFVANSSNEATELYTWLINDEDSRRKAALKARKRVLEEHTFRQRAKDILEIFAKLK